MNRHPWQQGISLLVLTSLLSACASFGPERTPSTPLNAQQLALSEDTSQAPQAGWWRQLHDDQLNALIDQALAHSPSLKLAADRLGEARAAVGLNESTLGPQVNLNAVKDRQLYSVNGLFPPPIGGNYYNSYTLSLNAAWELDFWGKNRARVKAALGQARAAAYEGQQAQLALTQAVIGQYTALQREFAQIRVNQSRIQLAQTRLLLMRARVSAGLLSADNLHTVEQGIAGLQAQNAGIQGDIQRTRHALAALTGQNPSALDNLTPHALGDAPSVNEARLTADLLGRRPDIASQREQVASMEENIKVARAQFYPDVSISGLIGLNSLEYGKLFQSNSKIVDFQPAISLPIFHSGQLRANLRVEQARYDQAVDSYNQAVLNGLKEAADALTGQQQANTQLADSRRGFDASRKLANAMLLRLKAGMVGKLEVLDSQDNQLAEEGAHLDAQAAARLAWANLNTAMGGGMTANPATR
ncbi:efflux transporter outer membrane subunit [Paludibacterium purpuratum]|uniref:NodT family efflux transporter outer membrane factor (OMF) lipoprotein n=1 Tax=Paludibacterium purpuratum TaxID=1144873 RepID=A0A4R7B7P2_9NEIS|nr:efflux transporter outer membrane subunit [Paludibacterium purpuratum]TDR80738.1 NodT family efflux transporter outer membrane factor (OMF) lipoprotein [Paludibacterium purpuratum]